ncbi:cyclin-dependent kinase 7-like [Zophobas morio]
MHTRGVIHRDIKPNNILLNEIGEVKICDFGMSRICDENAGDMTCQVVSRCYRSPELLCGIKHYGCEIDIWAFGCLFAEILLGKPLFKGDSDINQLSEIFSITGPPSEDQ